MHRLEQVATRLEQLESSLRTAGISGATVVADAQKQQGSSRQEPLAKAAAADTSRPAGDVGIVEYDAIVSNQVQHLLDAASQLDPKVVQLTAAVETAFREARIVLAISAASRKPSEEEYQALLQPIADVMTVVHALSKDKLTPKHHARAVEECLAAFFWLTYSGPNAVLSPPAQFIQECWQAAEFYSHKVVMEYRAKDEAHVAWTRALKTAIVSLKDFAQQRFSSGLVWQAEGVHPVEAASALRGASGRPQPSAAAPANPQPSAAPPLPSPSPPSAAVNGRAGDSAVPPPAASQAAARKVPPAKAAKAPRIALENDRKWAVEHHIGQNDIVVRVSDPKHVVYIYNCTKCVIQVEGKVNTISIDQCKDCGILFHDVIATCEMVNSSGLQVQTKGRVPTMSIEKVDGCQLFLPHTLSRDPNFQLVTARTSHVNVNVVNANEDDSEEHPLPEQYISTFQNGKLVTKAASHVGA